MMETDTDIEGAMTISREFKQNAGKPGIAIETGPVFIIERGCPAYALPSMDEYQRFTAKSGSIAEGPSMPETPEVSFVPPRMAGGLYKPAELD